MPFDRCAFAMKLLASQANKTKQATDAMGNLNSAIQFELRGEREFYVKMKEGSMTFCTGKHPHPDATIKADAENFFKIMSGEIDQDEAFTGRKYEIEGSIQDAVRFRRIAELTRQAHSRLFSLAKLLSFL